MDFKDFTAGIDDDSKRLDHILERILDGFSNARLQEITRKRLVRLNQKRTYTGDRVHEGDVISVAAFLFPSGGEKKSSGRKEDYISTAGPEIVFKNRHILIINKPRGIPVQPSPGGGECLSSLVARLHPGEGDSLSFRTGPLHRIDRNTTGLLAFSQSSVGAKWFSQAMADHEIKKTYLGIAEGRLEKSETWIDFLSDGKNVGGFHRMDASADEEKGRKAITHATPLAHGKNGTGDLTLVQYDIETGRKHQIRCQSEAHGHPLLGDSAYGGHGDKFFLHAASMIFPDGNPAGLPHQIKCDIPDDFKKNLDLNLLNWDGQLIIFH